MNLNNIINLCCAALVTHLTKTANDYESCVIFLLALSAYTLMDIQVAATKAKS